MPHADPTELLALEADASRTRSPAGSARGKEAAEERNGGAHSQEGLAVEGEEGEGQDGVGVEVERLDPVMVQNGEEETGERGDQAGKDRVEEERVTRRKAAKQWL